MDERAVRVLAVDLGTSGPKVGLVAIDGTVEDWAFCPVPTHFEANLGAEQDPEDWWSGVAAATRQVLARSSIEPELIAAVACTGQWSGTVSVDHNGRSVDRALIWLDGRGVSEMPGIVGGPITVAGYAPLKALQWIRLAGGAPTRSGKDPVAHIRWVQRHRPDSYRRTAVFLEPKDYLNLRLTGVAAGGYDSIALHWVTDNRRNDAVRYHDRLLAMSGLDPARLPELHAPGAVLGPLTRPAAAELGLRPETPVVVGTPDVHSAAIGAGAVAHFVPVLYLGTSSWLVCHVPFKKTDLRANMASLPSAVGDRWLLLNEQDSAGACLDFLSANLGILPGPSFSHAGTRHHPHNGYAGYSTMAERSPPGANGVLFGPWLNGERTPVENPNLRGSFTNLSLTTRPDDIVRSVFEGVALNSRWLLENVERFVGQTIDNIRIVGGGAQSDVWCQIHADVLNRTLFRPADPHLANLRGAARLGFDALALARVDQPLNRLGQLRAFRPQPQNVEVYDDRFDSFMEVYRAGRRFHRRPSRGLRWRRSRRRSRR